MFSLQQIKTAANAAYTAYLFIQKLMAPPPCPVPYHISIYNSSRRTIITVNQNFFERGYTPRQEGHNEDEAEAEDEDENDEQGVS